MKKLNKIPSEEVYEIELQGSFIPEKFTPFWFVQNKLLGEKEAEESNIIDITPGERSVFSTKFIRFFIENDTFSVSTKEFLTFDLVKDMAISVANLLKDSIMPSYSVNMRLHYSFDSEKDRRKVLNNLNGLDSWNNIVDSPQVYSLKIIEEKKLEKKELNRMISLFPCNRPDMKNTIHVYVTNFQELNSDKSSVSSIIEDDNDSLNESISIANKIINLYF